MIRPTISHGGCWGKAGSLPARVLTPTKQEALLGINNSEPAPSGDTADVTRAVRELKAYLDGLQAEDLTTADRAALRSLFDELKTMTASVKRGGPIPPPAIL